MGDVSCFWRNSEFHDATLLLGSDSLLLEHSRKALQESCDSTSANLKKRKASPSARTKKAATLTPGSSSSSSDPPAAFSAADAAEAGQVLKIPVHRIVLSTCSHYFKAAISTLVGDNAARSFHPIIVAREENVHAAQGVLQFMYTKQLDVNAVTAVDLMQFLMIADRWVVPGCVTACCKALAALPAASLSLADAHAIYGPARGLLPPSLINNLEFKPVLEVALSKLLLLFGDVPTVVACPTLTSQLLQLPAAAMLALLGSDALTTDCEDSVLMLLSWWKEARRPEELATGSEDEEAEEEDEEVSPEAQGKELQLTAVAKVGVPGEVGEVDVEVEEAEDEATTHDADDDQDREGANDLLELMGTVRYSRLSATHLAQAMLLMPGLAPSNSQLAELHQFRALSPRWADTYQKDIETDCPAGWFKPQRPLLAGRPTRKVELTLPISVAQLDSHLAAVQAMKQGGPVPERISVSVDFMGLLITLSFVSNIEEGSHCSVFLGVGVRLPKCSSKADLQRAIPGSVALGIRGSDPDRPHRKLRLPQRFYRGGVGMENFVQQASKLPGDPLALSWWEPFIVDGQVKITAEFKDER